MKTLDFNTSAGIRAAADYVENWAQTELPEIQGVGCALVIQTDRGVIRIRGEADACRDAARMLRRRAPEAGRRKSGRWGTPTVRTSATPLSGIRALDAMRVYGCPKLVLEAIRGQLAAQSADMDPADVRRCQRAAQTLEKHIAAEDEKARQQELAAVEAAWLEDAKRVTPKQQLEPGTIVRCEDRYRGWVGVVQRPMNGSDWQVRVTHWKGYSGVGLGLHRHTGMPLMVFRSADMRTLGPVPELIAPILNIETVAP